MLGYVALKRPNEAETVAYRLTVCNSLLSAYSLNGVCVCVCPCEITIVMQEFNGSVPCKHLKFNNGATLATIDPGGRPVRAWLCELLCGNLYVHS